MPRIGRPGALSVLGHVRWVTMDHVSELRDRVRRVLRRLPAPVSAEPVADDRDTAAQVRSRLAELNRQLLQDGDHGA